MSRKKDKDKKRKSKFRLFKLFFVMIMLALFAALLYGPNPIILFSKITALLSSAKAYFVTM
jgi:hypothetical protein